MRELQAMRVGALILVLSICGCAAAPSAPSMPPTLAPVACPSLVVASDLLAFCGPLVVDADATPSTTLESDTVNSDLISACLVRFHALIKAVTLYGR
jgi:hypothetical protein